MARRILIFLISVIIVSALVVALLFRQWIWGPNVLKTRSNYELYIPTGSSAKDVRAILRQEKWLHNNRSFKWLSRVMHYDKDKVPPGKYVLDPGMSNLSLISMLRAGKQTPVNMTFNSVRYVEELAGKISQYIEADSVDITSLLRNEDFCRQRGFDTFNILSLFIPNTYELYWNTSALQLVRRMDNEHSRFWQSEGRLSKADSLGLTPAEVFTLASIVEKETLVASEKSTIAAVYLNRLRKGMRLQADPTVVFAMGDFSIQRVLHKHLDFDSPYNTYRNEGLPPGPICMPDISTIDAVLNAENNEYLFFCARAGGGGRHAFAKTLRGHMQNAREYQNWLQENRIR